MDIFYNFCSTTCEARYEDLVFTLYIINMLYESIEIVTFAIILDRDKRDDIARLKLLLWETHTDVSHIPLNL